MCGTQLGFRSDTYDKLLTGKLLYHGTPSNAHGSMYQLEVVFRHGDIGWGYGDGDCCSDLAV